MMKHLILVPLLAAPLLACGAPTPVDDRPVGERITAACEAEYSRQGRDAVDDCKLRALSRYMEDDRASRDRRVDRAGRD